MKTFDKIKSFFLIIAGFLFGFILLLMKIFLKDNSKNEIKEQIKKNDTTIEEIDEQISKDDTIIDTINDSRNKIFNGTRAKEIIKNRKKDS